MQIIAFLRALFVPRTHLALENLALRQQIAVLKRSVPRPRVQRRDRIFWVLLRRGNRASRMYTLPPLREPTQLALTKPTANRPVA